MKVLLTESAERIIAATILTVPGCDFGEAVLETLSGEGCAEGGFVAEAIDPVVATAVRAAARERRHAAVTPRVLFEDLWWMARVLAPYVVDSRILLHLTPTGSVLDGSKATRVGASTEPQGPRSRCKALCRRPASS